MAGVQRYVWDDVNRAQSICGEAVGARYEYRADGMRVKKVADLTITWNPGDENQGSGFYDENLSVNKPTTRYYYDGQMCVEEDYTVWVGPFQGQSTVVTRYGVGARGIDWMERSGSGGGVSFPLYDGHGNMIATLSRSGSGSLAVSNARSYDVWGSVRSGSSTGDPNTRYCANLGHKQDDESGLLYMRARYYEPWTGRFVTEDPARDGWNWFVYADNCGNAMSDPQGQASMADLSVGVAIGQGLLSMGTNLALQYFFTGEIDWAEAFLALAVGAAAGMAHHGYKTVTYVFKSPGHMKNWWRSVESFPEFVRKAKKVTGWGTPNSRLGSWMLLQWLIGPSFGTGTFSIWNLFVAGWMGEE